jgi:CubicO group peptidase (beta-lactamase class C family)
MSPDLLRQARDYAFLGGGSGMIVRSGKLVYQWGDVTQRYDLKSSTKSIGITALALAIADGKLALSDRASQCHPQFGSPPQENRQTGWLGQITLFHLASQNAGFDKNGGNTDLLFRPGTKWA